MDTLQNVIDTIGNTPLIRLRAVLAATGCEIFGKAEFLNPGGSVKDRAALCIVRDAESRRELEPGGVIVDGTAGNTGIGLALVGNGLGYRTVIVIPETQSVEKLDLLRLYGADVRPVPAKPYSDPGNFIHVAERLARELAASEPRGVLWANQFDNTANRDTHYRTTAREIWEQTDGRIDGFICSVGTGGTLGGVSVALKERNPDVVIALADPMGAALYHYYRDGELRTEGDSITEGIGQIRITRNLEDAIVDEAFQITDHEALPYLFDLLVQEGLCLGGSSAINVAGAVRLARLLGPDHIIVTILACATKAGCSTLISCVIRACRFPGGCRNRSRIDLDLRRLAVGVDTRHINVQLLTDFGWQDAGSGYPVHGFEFLGQSSTGSSLPG
jgi:cysteine synthase A